MNIPNVCKGCGLYIVTCLIFLVRGGGQGVSMGGDLTFKSVKTLISMWNYIYADNIL